MLGVTMGAVQELAGHVERIERAVGLGAKNSARVSKHKPMKKAA
jgi:hypothetical protein